MPERYLRAFILAALGLAGAGATHAYAACQLVEVASLAITSDNDLGALVPVDLNGTTKNLLVDTGGSASMLTDTVVDQLKLERYNFAMRGEFYDYSGNPIRWAATVPSLQIGNLHASNVHVLVYPSGPNVSFAGTLAPDFLIHYDVEFDFAANKMNLFSQDHCPGQVVYWTHGAVAAVPLRIDDAGHAELTVTLDGKEMHAILDTGSTFTLLRQSDATDIFAIAMDAPDVTAVKSQSGSGKEYKRTFKQMSIGGVIIANPTLRLTPGSGATFGLRHNLVLGMQEIRALHIFVSYGERMLYVTAADAH